MKLRRLKIAIATAGRFHVLDLARELQAHGHDVLFYSYVSRDSAVRFGLLGHCHRPLLPFAAPALAWDWAAPYFLPQWREQLTHGLLNRAVMLRLKPCDVFICMSGIYLEAARFAKQRYGAQIWLERGGRHVLSQDEILKAVPGAERPSAITIDRELKGYALADKIVIPSNHVEESFRRDPKAHAKLFMNPYGVDLAMFPPQKRRWPHEPFTFLFVGRWSLQKGCDVLCAAIGRLQGVRLVHVGKIGDLKFPRKDARFVHFDPVPQQTLQRFYADADAFVLASRQDGFGMVLSQALASGLPIICTDRTGGSNLAHTPALAACITVVPSGDEKALAAAMATVADRVRSGRQPALNDPDRQTLSWTSYGLRYNDELLRSFPECRSIHLACKLHLHRK